MSKIYLASPLFNDEQKTRIMNVVSFLRAKGHEVFVPMEHSVEGAWDISNRDWAKQVFLDDVKAINECQVVVCIYEGLYSDSGTAWELGYSMARGKRQIILYTCKRDELQSLMCINENAEVLPYVDYEQIDIEKNNTSKFPLNLS